MKQPICTEGKWKKLYREAQLHEATGEYKFNIESVEYIKGKTGLPATAWGKTKEEAETNAERIIESVNMHSDFMELAKTIFEAYTDKGEKNLSALEISFFIAAKKLLEQANKK